MRKMGGITIFVLAALTILAGMQGVQAQSNEGLVA
jgi:hypothetical protein